MISSAESVSTEVSKVLVIDDDRGDFLIIEGLLRSLPNSKFNLNWASNYQDGIKGMISNEYDVYLLDYRLGPDDGLDLLREARRQGCNRPVILLTGFGDYQLDLQAMSSGAADFLVKDQVEAPLLERSIRYAIEHWRGKQRLEASLREKEVLLKEIHHRVKNNLQVVLSLLRLQAEMAKGEPSYKVLQICCDRIRSIALVHEKLYSSSSLEAIEFREYVQSFLGELVHSYGIDPKQIKVTLEAESMILPVTSAIPCGLILHELISNAFTHAFPDGKEGNLKIVTKRLPSGECYLAVSDDGVGLPPADKAHEWKSLGMQVVEIMVTQLLGTLKITREKGTKFEITFSEAAAESPQIV